MAESKAHIRNKTVGTAVTDAEKVAFQMLCDRLSTTPSALVRHLLSKVCPEITSGERPAKALKPEGVKLNLSRHDAQALEVRARSEGTTRSNWLRKVVRAALHRTPQFHNSEIQALRESNRELAAIGRNLNQIAHQFNIHRERTDLSHLDGLLELIQVTAVHRRKVSALINASWGRYSDDSGEGIE